MPDTLRSIHSDSRYVSSSVESRSSGKETAGDSPRKPGLRSEAPSRFALFLPPGWIAVRVSTATAALLLIVLLVLRFSGTSISIGQLTSIVLLSALCTFVTAQILLVPRLIRIRRLLGQLRRQEFDFLPASVSRPSGDELNNLIWQVYRTAGAVEKEIRKFKRMENYRREFLGDVSHELKTPLFAVQGFAETLLDGALNDERVNRKFIEKILKNAQRLSNLARDLSHISGLETGDLRMSVKPFGLRRLVREVVESLELAAGSRSVALEYDVRDDLPAVMGDRERIRQVLTNLVDNAIKYNNPGGQASVCASMAPGGEILIAVTDTGIGIAPQDLPRLTERFFRVDRSRSRDEGGTGLGLAIIKHILAAHGRKLFIESTPGRGSVFSFTLPIDKSVQQRG